MTNLSSNKPWTKLRFSMKIQLHLWFFGVFHLWHWYSCFEGQAYSSRYANWWHLQSFQNFYSHKFSFEKFYFIFLFIDFIANTASILSNSSCNHIFNNIINISSMITNFCIFSSLKNPLEQFLFTHTSTFINGALVILASLLAIYFSFKIYTLQSQYFCFSAACRSNHQHIFGIYFLF